QKCKPRDPSKARSVVREHNARLKGLAEIRHRRSQRCWRDAKSYARVPQSGQIVVQTCLNKHLL
ncbi:hypothetical protein, partial [Citrobacter portucalensis]|uniref:hypothetical protein n=1 Tax=Citrobacter portucalensis TaxID=1639133 RepID=UPI001CB6E939